MKIRRFLFWVHLCAGSIAGIVIAIMCVTGVLLAFERQINSWADALKRLPVSAAGSRVSVDRVVERFREQKLHPTALAVYSDPKFPLAVSFGRERILFVDPYSGLTLGESSRSMRNFFRGVEKWHRALGQALSIRGAGRAITGACNLAFLLLLLSGTILWLPRKWQWRYLRPILLYRGGLRGRQREWSWHNVTAFWCALPLLLIILSGVVMSYTWANDLLYLVYGETPPQQGSRPGQESAPHAHAFESARQASTMDLLFARAKQQVPGWQSITLQIPPAGNVNAVFTVDQGKGGQPNKRSQLTLDQKSAAVVNWQPFSSNTPGRKLRILARFTHTGEAGGIIGQFIAMLASLGGTVLVFTGLAMAIRRLRRQLAARAARERTPVKIASTLLASHRAGNHDLK